MGPELAGALGDCSERRRWGLRRAVLLMATLPHRRLNKVSQPAEAPPTLSLGLARSKANTVASMASLLCPDL